MAASSRVRTMCSRLQRVLWLTTLIAALLHSAMCPQSPDDSGPSHTGAPAAETGAYGSLSPTSSPTSPAPETAEYRADDEGGGPGHDVPPAHRYHHAVLRAPTPRSDVPGICSFPFGAAPDLPQTTGPAESHRLDGSPLRPAGATLLTMIGISRT